MKGESYDSRSLYFIRKSMKIFFAPSGYPNEIYPLANTFLQEQAEALANAGHEVIVLNAAQKGLREYSGKMNRRIETFTSGHVPKKSFLMGFRFLLTLRTLLLPSPIT